jgi:hypothetical protein
MQEVQLRYGTLEILSDMKIGIDRVMGQIYLLPYVKITHTKWLNGSYEFIIGWFNYQLFIGTK